jgi:hypothetical protein
MKVDKILQRPFLFVCIFIIGMYVFACMHRIFDLTLQEWDVAHAAPQYNE